MSEGNEELLTQEQVNKLVGEARKEGRKAGIQKAKEELEAQKRKDLEQSLEKSEEWKQLADERASKLAEMEPLAEQVEGYKEVIAALLSDKVEALGDRAKAAVEALPDSLTDLDKLNWLRSNAGLFSGEEAENPGTPKRHQRKQGERTSASRRRRVTL